MFTIAIIGRPNVGKSTLFNRITGRKEALVHDMPGVTRDRRINKGSIGPMDLSVIDTAGLEEAENDALETRMFQQTELAVEEADLSLMVIDGRVGVTPIDMHFANWLRKKNKPVVLVINKCEGNKASVDPNEIIRFGFGEPVRISAEHGEGMVDLYQALEPYYEKYLEEFAHIDLDLNNDDGEKSLQIAIIGRPNAGKSTLVNAILDEERLLTGPEAGITRDSISIDWNFEGKKVKLIDTAGIRRKAKVKEKLEKLSLGDCFRAVRYANVCVLLVDATMPLEKQDVAIADMMVNEGRALVIGVNKWDKVENKDETRKMIREKVEEMLPQIKGVPIVTLSALKKQNIPKLLHSCLGIYDVWNQRVSTAKLNQWIKDVEARHLPPIGNTGKRIRLKYITQGNSRPPTFTLFTNLPEQLPKSYVRYVTNSLRDTFNMPGVPIRLMLRKTDNPYEGRRNKKAYTKRKATHK
ncbi:MAG: ribosome biogenesis GTPase Der [Rickettsiales bacterium]|nr:ribosome biogenesis GTPase Der [Rickettsiales bacterium]